MKRALLWVIGVGGMGLALVFVLRGQGPEATTAVAEPAKGQPMAAQAAPAATAGKRQAEEKVAYTFENEEKLREFTTLWQQRQGILLRMTVLQAYWRQEETTLAQLNQKFTADYKLDATKNYFLDPERRVLVEREAPPAGQPVSTPQGQKTQ